MSTTPTNHILVHKEGEEGALTIDRLTGRITTPLADRPEWADGLATALLSERIAFYQTRLGDGSTFQQIADAQAIEVRDLSWIGVDANGDEQEIEADTDYRMDLLANALGMDRETGEISGNILAEHESARFNPGRVPEDMRALEESVREGFADSEDPSASVAAGGQK